MDDGVKQSKKGEWPVKRKHILDGIILERRYVEARIVDSPHGYKMVIPVFNETVPVFYVGKVMETVEAFLDVYTTVWGVSSMPESLYVDGNLSVCLDRDIPIGKKYELYVVIILEEGHSVKANDYIIKVPIAPTDAHFGEFRQCFLDTFEAMVGIG